METVYRLRERIAEISQMQEASLSHPFLGLKATHGLIGTEEWWNNIAAGALPLHSVRGVVRGLWLGMYHSEPGSYLLELVDKTYFSGMTGLDADESASKFTLGRYVEVDYVIQELKYPREDQTTQSRVEVEIRLDSFSDSSVVSIGNCYFDRIEATKYSQSIENESEQKPKAKPTKSWWPWR